MRVERERGVDPTFRHDGEGDGVGEREILILVALEPVPDGASLQLGGAPLDQDGFASNLLYEPQTGGSSTSPQQQRVRLRDDRQEASSLSPRKRSCSRAMS